MTFGDLLVQDAWRRADVERVPLFGDSCSYEFYEVTVAKSPKRASKSFRKSEEEKPTIRRGELKQGEAKHWINETGSFRRQDDPSTSAGVAGRLRLLFKIGYDGPQRICKEGYDCLVKNHGVPMGYLFDLACRECMPTRTAITHREEGEFLGIVSQSPRMDGASCTAALSYNPRTSTTTGFVGLQLAHNRGTNLALHSLFEALEDVSDEATNPLLVPTVLYGRWVTILGAEHRYVFDRIGQDLRPLMKEAGIDYEGSSGEEDHEPNQEKYEQMVRVIIGQIRYLTSTTASFVSRSGPAIFAALDSVKDFRARYGIDVEDHDDLRSYVDHLNMRVDIEQQHRERLISRLDIYLQVIYNLMQRDIAVETKRDSSAMKSLSLLGVIFLPATAIATIMAPFVNAAEDGNNFTMVKTFWVFWAVAVPITLVLVAFWIIWQNRRDLHVWLFKQTNKRDRRKSSPGANYSSDGSLLESWNRPDRSEDSMRYMKAINAVA